MNKKLPPWFKQELPDNNTLKMSELLLRFKVDTVCRQAKCPNATNCFNNKKATFMILGDSCTRDCSFCNVKKSKKSNLPVDEDEPRRISEVVRILGLDYVVITSVTRDDLIDDGASIFAETIKSIRRVNKNTKVEALIPDFRGSEPSINEVIAAKPDLLSHNIETVRRISKILRPSSDYQLSLGVLSRIKGLNPEMHTKSSLMLGLGETQEEVLEAMKDLRGSLCDSLTLGQYLAPSVNHYPIKEFVNLEQFKIYHDIGVGLGFKAVLSGPLVRSSYRADEIYKELCYV